MHPRPNHDWHDAHAGLGTNKIQRTVPRPTEKLHASGWPIRHDYMNASSDRPIACCVLHQLATPIHDLLLRSSRAKCLGSIWPSLQDEFKNYTSFLKKEKSEMYSGHHLLWIKAIL
jgi:hypothetical protein